MTPGAGAAAIRDAMPRGLTSAEGLFVCPSCRGALSWETSLRCAACATTYLAADGTPCFNDRGTYHGPIPPRPEMHRLLALARDIGYRAVLEEHLRATDPDLARYLTDTRRADGLALLPLQGTERVLDFGCSFGVLSRRLASAAAQVVALDVTHEKLQFLGLVASQDGIANLVPVCNGDPVRLPFADGSFDWVILNAVFEYLPRATGEPDVRRGHLRVLREIGRVLRPGGGVYLATKNRLSYGALRSRRFHQLLPRPVARRLLGGGHRRDPDRHVIYTLGGYRRLFRDAGFTVSAAYWALPTLWYPRQMVALTRGRAAAARDVRRVTSAGGAKRAGWLAAAATGLLPLVVPNYVFLLRWRGAGR
ncbi:MAG TPA: class I SAM-dependent methyltransferase [Candidatus Tectomicrobia bacterium]|nr:class I SAM-dependent methyltransferase [Candidatus Tectomicrobia bacterium]